MTRSPTTPVATVTAPECQGSAARRWMEARQAELLPVDYYHVVFTLPAPVAALAYQNKTIVWRSCSAPPPDAADHQRRSKASGLPAV